jgi:hypothetical protein|tara:strand:- start:362 stop:1015 length:654 start_codon:yes stop_codon:yes gene_type:complete
LSIKPLDKIQLGKVTLWQRGDPDINRGMDKETDFVTECYFPWLDIEALKIEFDKTLLAPFEHPLKEKCQEENSWFEYAPNWHTFDFSNDMEYYIDSNPETVRACITLRYMLDTKKVTPKYFKQMAGSDLPWHSDPLGSCAINIALEEDTANLEYMGNLKGLEDFHYNYRIGLLNTVPRHRVQPFHTDRRTAKFQVFGLSYKEVRERLLYHDAIRLPS